MKLGRLGVVVATATTACVAAMAAPGAHAAPAECGEAPVTRPFLPWLDPALYFLMPGGAAESSGGWSFSGARLAGGNERFYVNSPKDRFSVSIPAGASAVTPWTCVNLAHPTMRFFAVADGSPLATLTVTPEYRDRKGRIRSLAGLPVLALGHPSWAPTLPLPILLDTVAHELLTLDLDTAQVRFRFSASKGFLTSAGWAIDDVYVDPWVRGG